MRVLVLGGTGSIGRPILRELLREGHDVVALVRSADSADRVAALGARPLAGDISVPHRWLEGAPRWDAVIHAAATFDASEEETDRRLLDALLPYLAAADHPVRFIYTGGCWLYGATGDSLATEATAFDPLPAYAWCLPHMGRVLAAPGIEAMVIHPAMVYEPAGGVFERFRSDAIAREAVRVVSSEHVRWPLVHAEDLAVLYRLALEAGAAGECYIGSAIEGMPVGRIARAYARRYGTRHLDPEICPAQQFAAELGPWAYGYALDQRLSGGKARRRLGWRPRHLDPEGEIAALA
jgi:nucleoside-diphosphate-sugar epimerase